jgi:hypothetical protein
MMKFQFRVEPPRSTLMSFDRAGEVLVPWPVLSYLYSISGQFVHPRPALQAGGRG